MNATFAGRAGSAMPLAKRLSTGRECAQRVAQFGPAFSARKAARWPSAVRRRLLRTKTGRQDRREPSCRAAQRYRRASARNAASLLADSSRSGSDGSVSVSARGAGGASTITCAFAPEMPKPLTPARRGRLRGPRLRIACYATGIRVPWNCRDWDVSRFKLCGITPCSPPARP